jgi:hypothetical protein
MWQELQIADNLRAATRAQALAGFAARAAKALKAPYRRARQESQCFVTAP